MVMFVGPQVPFSKIFNGFQLNLVMAEKLCVFCAQMLFMISVIFSKQIMVIYRTALIGCRSQWPRGLRHQLGRATTQAVGRWLSTAAARVQTRVYSCGICGRQSGAGARFIRVLRFPPPIFIPPTSPQSLSPIIRGWYNRPVMAAVPKVTLHKFKKRQELSSLDRTLGSWSSNPIRGMEVCLRLFCVCVR
jgi:hypothetical protein